MKKRIISLMLFVALPSFAYDQQTGSILELYVHQNGSMALKMKGGFSAGMKAECPNNNGYAGIRDSDPLIKSYLLAQYAAGKEIKIGASGCSGAWINIVDARGF
jgi:uncharacterized protein YneR